MTNFEGAYFIILAIIAFAFLFYDGKFSLVFRVFAAMLFFVLALVMFAEYGVAFTSTVVTPSGTFNETRNLIIANNTTQPIIGYVFLALGILSVMKYFIDALYKAKKADV